jgi:hypothetical protein
MHVLAFAASLRATENGRGGVDAEGFPMTSARVAAFPAQITIPLVLAVYAPAGTDLIPSRYIVARSAEGEVIGSLECTWRWPDVQGSPVKFWVSTQHLPIVVRAPGIYGIGLYEHPDSTVTDHVFPLPVVDAGVRA